MQIYHSSVVIFVTKTKHSTVHHPHTCKLTIPSEILANRTNTARYITLKHMKTHHSLDVILANRTTTTRHITPTRMQTHHFLVSTPASTANRTNTAQHSTHHIRGRTFRLQCLFVNTWWAAHRRPAPSTAKKFRLLPSCLAEIKKEKKKK